jgi:hypothetical protein
MRLAVISDCHVLGPIELVRHAETYQNLGQDLTPMRRRWRRGLYRVRRRFWNTHPEMREVAFRNALLQVSEFDPDWVIANGDYGGDHGGVGVSDQATFESAARVVNIIRTLFAQRARFVFGDHDLGKYSTELREGGIRLNSLEIGERKLGIPSFWHERDEDFHLIGVNSSLFTLDLFLPEALASEIPAWRRLREEHIEHVSHAFDGLSDHARVLLFCHDPSALHALRHMPVVNRRLRQIEMTVIGHLHAPGLLKLARLVPAGSKWKPKYPVARIVAQGLEGVRSWKMFHPVVCPSTFGTGHHVRGGILFIEKNEDGRLVARRRRIQRRLTPSDMPR